MKLENILLDEDGVAKLWDFSSCVSIPQGETFVKHKYEWGDTTPRISLYGFMDPNLWKKGVVSKKTDVYGIGILMQKLLSGEQRCQDFYFEKLVKGENETFQSFLPFSLALRFPNWLSKRRMEEMAKPEVEVLSEEPRFRDLCFEEVEELYYEEAFNRSIVSPIYSPRRFPNWLSGSMEEIADPEMIEEMGGITEEELCRMEDFLMLSQRCVGHSGQVPTMVEVAKELKKIQKSP
ncbi:unnamed protein product [Microthlaspi erraticum]|nr:unnamed protein product [Microthlaspi erraticum]